MELGALLPARKRKPQAGRLERITSKKGKRQMQTIRQFVERNNIRATVDYADSNPNMDADGIEMNHFKVTLRRGRRQMTVPFSQGLGISGEPTAEGVLDCLASDASTVENSQSFEDWAADLGYDEDSRRAERTYRAIERQREKLRSFLGSELYDVLLWDTERA